MKDNNYGITGTVNIYGPDCHSKEPNRQFKHKHKACDVKV